jgi:hypothetical protein
VALAGPLSLFFTEASERIRKFEPISPPPTWSSEAHVLVTPSRIDAPDIEKVIVQRNGAIVPPLRTNLVVRELV